MPCSAAAWMCDGSSRRASSPAYRRGCSVLTRPSMISGKPVKSSIERTSSPDSRSATAVPPVEMSSMPRPARPRAKSTMPRLSETDSSARRTRTSPGAVTSLSATLDEPGSAMRARIRQHPAGPRFGRLRPRALTAKITTDPTDGGVRMADTEEREVDKIGDPEHDMEGTADELSQRSEKLGDQIADAKQTHEKAQADANVPTAAGDWEDTEPDDSTGDDATGFDDPEDLDDDDEDLDDEDE